ncbi:MAG: hypothetical protein AAB071_07125, partial [Bacteroidota bacterium]
QNYCIRKLMKKIVIVFSLCFFALNFVFTQNKVDASTSKEAQHSILTGLQWLEKNQEQDGSWSHYPAITALVISSYLNSPQGFSEENNAAVENGVKFILQCQKPDGGIYVDELAGYNTAICIVALAATNNPEYVNEIQRARDFLLSLQWNEDNGYEKTDPRFGGIGYGDKERPDLSNLQWAIEALKESEKYRKTVAAKGKQIEFSGKQTEGMKVASKELFWENAIVFLSRCQNLKSTNEQSWAGNDGGFIYSPSESKAGDYTSYGSMTYAGMKSMIYANLSQNDERVKAAYEWVKKNYSVAENPVMGNQGLFYYYQTMAKALDAIGEDVIGRDSSSLHNWRKDILERLISLQSSEGFWVNENARWWENQKVLVTAYTIIAMEYALGK